MNLGNKPVLTTRKVPQLIPGGKKEKPKNGEPKDRPDR